MPVNVVAIDFETANFGGVSRAWLANRESKKGLDPGHRGFSERRSIRSSTRVHEVGSTRTWMELTPLGVAMVGMMFGSGGNPAWLESGMGGRDLAGRAPNDDMDFGHA